MDVHFVRSNSESVFSSYVKHKNGIKRCKIIIIVLFPLNTLMWYVEVHVHVGKWKHAYLHRCVMLWTKEDKLCCELKQKDRGPTSTSVFSDSCETKTNGAKTDWLPPSELLITGSVWLWFPPRTEDPFPGSLTHLFQLSDRRVTTVCGLSDCEWNVEERVWNRPCIVVLLLTAVRLD